MPARRIDNDEVKRRLRLVEDLLATATPHGEIVRQFCRAFNTTRRTAQRYLERVREELGLDAVPTLTKSAEIEAAAWRVHHLARNEGRFAAANGSLRLIAEINGLLKLRAEISGPDGKPVSYEINAAEWSTLQREIYGGERQGSATESTTES